MRSLTLLLAAVLLAACSTPQERAVRAQADMEQNMMIFGPACARLGYPTDSDQWRSCVLNLSTKEDLQRYNYPYAGGYYGPGYWHGGMWGPW